MQILGASTDDVVANAKFAEEQDFPYPLLCDTEREICIAYGACESTSDAAAKRVTYVIGPDGTIVQVHDTVDAREHPATLLAAL